VESLTRHDVAEYNGVKMVVVESDLLLPDPAVVVIPLDRRRSSRKLAKGW
jgi:toxin CcdB